MGMGPCPPGCYSIARTWKTIWHLVILRMTEFREKLHKSKRTYKPTSTGNDGYVVNGKLNYIAIKTINLEILWVLKILS